VARSQTRLLVLGKYLLFQLPGWAVVSAGAFAAHRWLGLDGWLGAGAVAAWMLKDAVLTRSCATPTRWSRAAQASTEGQVTVANTRPRSSPG
jgi:hypothetical protein